MRLSLRKASPTTPTILVVGQTPPPFGGQGLMIQLMLEGKYSGFNLRHVRMGFSSDMDDVGRVHFGKLAALVSVIVRTVWLRCATDARILYYPPAGPNRVPFYRDCVVLILTRWLFSKTIFHFHASGISELYPRLSWPARMLFRLAYSKPSLAIRTSSLNPDDGGFLNASHSITIPNGIPDAASKSKASPQSRADERTAAPPRLLFVGALYEQKGILDLVKACGILARSGLEFHLDLVGRVESREVDKELSALLQAQGINSRTTLHGVKLGVEKWAFYQQADIFVNPTYFDAESFSLVNVEAMMFSLPVVSTAWRGIPEVVLDQQTGLLVPPKSPETLAAAIERLLTDEVLRQQMGDAGRRRFLETYTADAFHSGIEAAFSTLLPTSSLHQ